MPKLKNLVLDAHRKNNALIQAAKLSDGTTLVARHDDLDRIMRCMKACKDIPDSELDAGIVKTLYDEYKHSKEVLT